MQYQDYYKTLGVDKNASDQDIRRAYRKVRLMVARLNVFLQEGVSGMRLSQLFLREQADMEQFREINRDHRDAELKSVRFESVFSAVAELMGSLTLATIVWAGGWRVLGEAITFGTLVAFIEYAGKFFPVDKDIRAGDGSFFNDGPAPDQG